MPMRDSIRTHSSLLARLKDLEDEAAWKEFCDCYGKLVRRLALAAGLRRHEAEDVVEEVFIGMVRNIGGFVYDRSKCSFKSWLSQMVRWRIRDQLRKRSPIGPAVEPAGEPEGADAASRDGPAMDAELERIWESEWKRHLIDTAVARVKTQVSAKQFQIFFLHLLKEKPVAEVTRRLKVSRGQVYLAKMRVGKLFQKELKAEMKRSG
jgi:RNA polymerase sigma factor (sigma-70 family)